MKHKGLVCFILCAVFITLSGYLRYDFFIKNYNPLCCLYEPVMPFTLKLILVICLSIATISFIFGVSYYIEEVEKK